MNVIALFIRRPVATTLLAVGLGLAGLGALFMLPVAPLPNIDLPTIVVSASMAGASPEVMANTVATPLERHLGAIADVTEMTSRSAVGSTRVILQFDISRDIDGAARDVQAAINAAHADLPTALRSNPTYNKFNPSSFPIMILALTSKTLTPAQIYDQASNILQQKLSQLSGVGDVTLAGAALPAVRIELNPHALFKYGIGLEDVRAAISSANAGANSPKGAIEQGTQRLQVYSNDNASAASDYQKLIVAYRNNAAVRLQDLGQVYDGLENIRNMGMANGKPAILVTITQQPGANMIQVVNRINQMLPELQHGALPPAIDLTVIQDTTTSIRNSVRDVEITLVLSTILVVLVVFLFLRNWRAMLVPAVSVPLSLLGTFGGMYLLDFTLDNFSLMALIISTGFVVDNTIVVLENVTRHRELGRSQLEAALHGAQEVAFTVISMSVSLVAVFLPILLLGGILGRLFHEFAVTLTVAIFMSLMVSLTVTPMMCAYLDFSTDEDRNWITRLSRTVFDRSLNFYRNSLAWSLDHAKTVMFALFVVVVLNVYLFVIIPKGFFPSVPGVQKLYYIGPQFRRERPQKGRYRQFYQIGAEAIGPPAAGSESPLRDAELLEMLATLLDRLGIRNWTLELNSVGCGNDRKAYDEALRKALDPVKARMCVDCQRRAVTNPLRVFDCKVPEDQPIIETLPRISQYLDEPCRAHFNAVQEILKAVGVPFVLNDRLVRGLDYYTRTAFEFTHGALGAQNAILGGGRYDGLSESLGGPQAPGIGFAIGEDRVVLALQEAAAQMAKPADVYIAPLGEGMNREAARVARELRQAGIVVDVGEESFRLKKSLETAAKLGARFALIVGENEAQSGVFALKHLATGQQQSVPRSELAGRIQSGEQK